MTVVNIHEAKSQLSKLIKLVLEGQKVVIAKNNVPIAELKPYKNKKKKRGGFGVFKGQIEIVDNWKKGDKEVEKLMLESKLFPDE